MAIARRNIVLFEAKGHATVAALQTALNAQTFTAGFIPERFVSRQNALADASAGQHLPVMMQVNKTPYQDWIAVTAFAFVCIDVTKKANVAASQTLIQTAIDTQEAASKTLRDQIITTLMIAGSPKDVCILLFTDGAPAVS